MDVVLDNRRSLGAFELSPEIAAKIKADSSKAFAEWIKANPTAGIATNEVTQNTSVQTDTGIKTTPKSTVEYYGKPTISADGKSYLPATTTMQTTDTTQSRAVVPPNPPEISFWQKETIKGTGLRNWHTGTLLGIGAAVTIFVVSGNKEDKSRNGRNGRR